MLTLLLLRHAKSSWDDPSLDDFDRPLAPRGAKAASLMGAYIERHKLKPDLVLSSAAVRLPGRSPCLPRLAAPRPRGLSGGPYVTLALSSGNSKLTLRKLCSSSERSSPPSCFATTARS